MRDGSDPGLAIGYTREGGGELHSNLGMLPLRGCPAGSSSHTAADLIRLDRALRGGRLLDDRWTAWVYTGDLRVPAERSWQIGVLGGAPGVNAALEAGPVLTDHAVTLAASGEKSSTSRQNASVPTPSMSQSDGKYR